VVRCRELRLVSVVGADVTLRADKMATIHDLCLSYTHFQLNFQQTQHISDKFNFFTKAPVTLMLIKNLKTLFVKDATTISGTTVTYCCGDGVETGYFLFRVTAQETASFNRSSCTVAGINTVLAYNINVDYNFR